MKRLFTRRKSSTSTSTSTNSNSPSHNSVPGTDHRGESPISPTSSITQATAVAAAAKSSISAWNTAHPIVTDLVPPAAVVQRSQPTCVSPTTSCLSPAAAAAARGLGSDGVNGGSGTGGVGGPSRSLSISTVPIRPSLGTSTSSMSRAATSYGSAADDGHREGLGSEGGHQSNYGPRATQEIVATGSSGSGESEGKLSVGIDFGTTFSGVAYGSNRTMAGHIRTILQWPGSFEHYRKLPTCILYHQQSPQHEARVIAWGLEAKSATVREGIYKCEWFKLFLDPAVLREGRRSSTARLPDLPVGKEPIDIIIDYLSCLWQYAKESITEALGSVADLEAADVLLTVPAQWDAAGCQMMRDAAIKAGMVKSSRAGDTNWRDRLRIITEPEAAAIHASTLSTLYNLRPSQSFIICDAGGGTVDTAAYKLIGQLSQLEIAEMCARSGASCGSIILDLRFEALVRRILRDHPTHLDAASLLAFRHSFAETDKLTYLGEEDDDTLFRFNCFNIEDAHDPSCGLEHGELVIPGIILRRDVFDPVIDQVLALIETQLDKTPQQSVHALIMVGGFAASEYLMTRVRQHFHHVIPTIARPHDCDVATLQGAARYGLGLTSGRAAVSSVICPRNYIMKVKLPAEEIDHIQRPGFITQNDAGVEVCENRLSYLVTKGAVLRKGQRLRSRFCKFARGPTDALFKAVLYVSDDDRIWRYSDEGETYELCRWTVDLSTLPAFHQIASSGGGGYVEFDLGLSLDSAEVSGVLLDDDGVERGRATFEYIER